ncbi:hypothetical protein CRM22_002726, partial [Opisthorchis felineus]
RPEEAFEVVSDQLDQRRVLLNFSCRNPNTGSHDLLVATPNGYLCRFDGSTGEVLAYSHPPNGDDEKGDGKDHNINYCEMQESAYWSAMCISPDGNHVVLAAADAVTSEEKSLRESTCLEGPRKRFLLNMTNYAISFNEEPPP